MTDKLYTPNEFQELAEKVKRTRTAWLEQHGVPISEEFAAFAEAVGELTEAQSQVDALIQAANEAALQEAALKANYADSLSQKIKAAIESLITQPSALARHDEKLKAEFAAVMEHAIQQLRDAVCCDTETSCLRINEAANELEAAIGTNYASALDRRLAEARQSERDRCAIEVYKAYKAGNGELQRVAAMAANNIRAMGPTCLTCSGRGSIRWKEPNMECSKPCPDCTEILAELRRAANPVTRKESDGKEE